MAKIENALRQESTKKEDIITYVLALQRQCFCVTNSMKNLVKNWPV